MEEELAFIDGSSIYKRIVATGATVCSGGTGAFVPGDEEDMGEDQTAMATQAGGVAEPSGRG